MAASNDMIIDLTSDSSDMDETGKSDEKEVSLPMGEDKDKSSGNEDADDGEKGDDDDEATADEDKEEEIINDGNLGERTRVRNDELRAATAKFEPSTVGAYFVELKEKEKQRRLKKEYEEKQQPTKKQCRGVATSQSSTSSARNPFTNTDGSRKTLEERCMMPTQGFDESSASMEIDGRGIGTGTGDDLLPDETAEFGGRVFCKGRCLRVGASCVIGIEGFCSGDWAMSVPIVPVEETLLETIPDREGLSSGLTLTPCIGKYVQWNPHKEHLSDLVNAKDEEHISMPTHTYLPRNSRTGVLFGYVDMKNQTKRLGRRKSSPRVGDMFSSAGLFSHALTKCGFRLVMGVEKDKDAAMSFEALHSRPSNNDDGDKTGAKFSWCDETERWMAEIQRGQTVVYHGLVEEFLSRCEKDNVFKESIGQLHYIHLSPPCQGFSKQNRLGGVNDEENNIESMRILDVVRVCSPLIVSFENVLGLWTSDHICRYIKPIVYGLIAEGYDVSAATLNACDFGDPQIRPRFFLMAAAPCVPLPCFPRKTHGPPNSGLLPYVTLSDELGPYEDSYPEQEEELKRRDQDALADPNKPATSVLASKRLVHYSKNRHYSLEENAILMSHDPEIVQKLHGDDKVKQRQIGNGIPMGVGMALARQVHEILKYKWQGEDEWWAAAAAAAAARQRSSGSSNNNNDEESSLGQEEEEMSDTITFEAAVGSFSGLSEMDP